MRSLLPTDLSYFPNLALTLMSACMRGVRTHVPRHPVSKGRVPIAVNRLGCAAYELYDWLTYKAINSRYLLSLVVS